MFSYKCFNHTAYDEVYVLVFLAKFSLAEQMLYLQLAGWLAGLLFLSPVAVNTSLSPHKEMQLKILSSVEINGAWILLLIPQHRSVACTTRPQ